jgi:hypothetical protein
MMGIQFRYSPHLTSLAADGAIACFSSSLFSLARMVIAHRSRSQAFSRFVEDKSERS